ncbi:MAG: ABC transporter permease [Campylobacterales bacterium]|nr:ABC transporter permease [Campylobacterales bacterium]
MFRLAFKNIIFYKARTITTFLLTFITTVLFVVYVSMMDGSHNSMLQNSLKIYTGSIEIYKKGYRDVGGSEYLLDDTKAMMQKLSTINSIDAMGQRYESYALLCNKEECSASMVAGVDAKAEKQLSSLYKSLKEGEYLGNATNCLYMGSGLVKRLKLKLDDEVAFVGGASDGSFAADIFKLCGVFQTGLFEFDTTTTIVEKRYFDELMLSQNKASYITIKVKDLEKVDGVKKEIESKLNDESLEVLSWKTLMKNMVEAMEVDSIFGYISLALFCIVVFFVIMIYGFINVSSRVREFGVLMSVGVKKSQIFTLLSYEIFIISTIAIALATPIAGYICYHYTQNPIIIDGIAQTYKEYGIVSDELPFDFNIFTIFWNVLVIYGLNFLSIVYPFIYIRGFRVLEALKYI